MKKLNQCLIFFVGAMLFLYANNAKALDYYPNVYVDFNNYPKVSPACYELDKKLETAYLDLLANIAQYPNRIDDKNVKESNQNALQQNQAFAKNISQYFKYGQDLDCLLQNSQKSGIAIKRLPKNHKRPYGVIALTWQIPKATLKYYEHQPNDWQLNLFFEQDFHSLIVYETKQGVDYYPKKEPFSLYGQLGDFLVYEYQNDDIKKWIYLFDLDYRLPYHRCSISCAFRQTPIYALDFHSNDEPKRIGFRVGEGDYQFSNDYLTIETMFHKVDNMPVIKIENQQLAVFGRNLAPNDGFEKRTTYYQFDGEAFVWLKSERD